MDITTDSMESIPQPDEGPEVGIEPAEVRHLLENLGFEICLFIPFLDMRSDLALTKFSDRLLECDMFF